MRLSAKLTLFLTRGINHPKSRCVVQSAMNGSLPVEAGYKISLNEQFLMKRSGFSTLFRPAPPSVLGVIG